MRELVAEVGGILHGAEIAAVHAPVRNAVDHPADQLPDAGLAFRRPDLPVEVLTHHYISRGLRPIFRSFDVALLEDYSAFVVADRRIPKVPLNLVIRTFPS